MENYAEALAQVLKTITGSGTYCTSGVEALVNPGIEIAGIGPVGLPLNPIVIKEIIKSAAHKSPFGKGSETVLDTTVRSGWQVDAADVYFENEEWTRAVVKIVKNVKDALGLEKSAITATFYKLLIYETGDFFLPHKDSEKEPGMFGTLILGLPSKHTGGNLEVRFDGREEIIDFSASSGGFNISYAAFFADCEHEVRPITSGYRVCLVYNLSQRTKSGKVFSGPAFGSQTDELSGILKKWEPAFPEAPKVLLLGHQYTPANFSLSALKGHDRPRTESMLHAAESAGYFATLGLLTHYQMGELEINYSNSRYRSSRRYWDVEDYEDGTMGEIYEETTDIEIWDESILPGLGTWVVEEAHLISDFALGKDEPLEKEAEGFTGNEGMTMQYWYHYGAIVFWPVRMQDALMGKVLVRQQLKWMQHYLDNWHVARLQAPKFAESFIKAWYRLVEEPSRANDDLDFNPLPGALIRLADPDLVRNSKTQALLVYAFEKIDQENWLLLLQAFTPHFFSGIFKAAAQTGKKKKVNRITELLLSMMNTKDKKIQAFFEQHLSALPVYLQEINFVNWDPENAEDFVISDILAARKNLVDQILKRLLLLSEHAQLPPSWTDDLLARLIQKTTRKYINEALCPAVSALKPGSSPLRDKLFDFCFRDLSNRVDHPPSPPADWRRPVPKDFLYEDIWHMLRPFLESPTQRIFEYHKSESYRRRVESAIRNVTVDLSTKTIRTGSPHTLVLEKNQNAYNLAVGLWKEDVALLKKIKKALAQ